MPKKRIPIQETIEETTPLTSADLKFYYSSEDEGDEYFDEFKRDSIRRESRAADQLSMRLLQIDDDDSDTEERIIMESLALDVSDISVDREKRKSVDIRSNMEEAVSQAACERLCTMISLVLLAFALVAVAMWVGITFIGPPNQPVGPYELVERQVCSSQLFRIEGFFH
jgi:hypothetical protein